MVTADFKRSLSLAQDTLHFMVEHAIPPVPDNFQLYFDYVLGENVELKEAVNQILEGSKPLDQEDCIELYRRFFDDREAIDALSDVGKKMAFETDALLETVRAAGLDTKNYGDTLASVSDILGREEGNAAGLPAPAMNALVGQLVSATKQMRARTAALETRLEEANEEMGELRQNLNDIRKEAITDSLTGLGNRKYFDECLVDKSAEAAEEGQPLCLVMGDIDHFKSFNDTWGHQTGDQVLRLVAQCIKDNVKGQDQPARYGGEEFAVVLPHTPLEGAKRLADQIRQAVQSKKVVKRSTGEDLGQITMSFGAAQWVPGEGIEVLIQRADTCLYAAKQAGRNQVKGEDETDLDAVLGDAAKKRQQKEQKQSSEATAAAS
ncbi:MAG: GGDEF domain-containing protein [Pseudomonadota bacterium]